jgi:hypothetical protein
LSFSMLHAIRIKCEDPAASWMIVARPISAICSNFPCC